MITSAVVRIAVVLLAITAVLCLAGSVTLVVMWAVDGTRPISFTPLFISASLFAVASACAFVRREVQGWMLRSPALQAR